jgi:hypothetical protein
MPGKRTGSLSRGTRNPLNAWERNGSGGIFVQAGGIAARDVRILTHGSLDQWNRLYYRSIGFLNRVTVEICIEDAWPRVQTRGVVNSVTNSR